MLLIFTLPLLLLVIGYSVFKIVKCLTSKDRSHLKPVFFIWILPVCLIVFDAINSLKSIDKNDIVGTYEIDKAFYPGSNANWQNSIFSFVINEKYEFFFYEKLADGNFKVIKGKVEFYRNSKPALFRIVLAKPHHLIDIHPALYRQKFNFYYVFETSFGNMFYRKVSGNTANKKKIRGKY